MRTVITAWAMAYLLYLVTPYALANEQDDTLLQTVWTGYHVVGDVCINVKDKRNGQSESAEMWLLNNGDVKVHAIAQGLTCLEVMLGHRNELQVALPNEHTEVYVVRDDTTPFFTVELPF